MVMYGIDRCTPRNDLVSCLERRTRALAALLRETSIHRDEIEWIEESAIRALDVLERTA